MARSAVSLNAEELDGYRRTQTDHLPIVGVRLVRTPAGDGAGGQTVAWVADDSTHRVRVGSPSAAELVTIGDRFGQAPHAIVTAAWDTPLRVGDRLVIYGGDVNARLDGRVIELTGRLSTLEQWETAARFAAINIEPGGD